MKETVQSQLNEDHRNIAWLLKLMKRETELVEKAEPANLELLHDIMRYMTTYPDDVHHRLEDLMFRSLMERQPATRDALARMYDEHEELAHKGQSLLTMLRQVVDGALVERQALVTESRGYTDLLYRHMVYENETVYPLADQSLQDDDWSDVAQRFEAQKDPVFGPIKDADFTSLLDFIARESC